MFCICTSDVARPTIRLNSGLKGDRLSRRSSKSDRQELLFGDQRSTAAKQHKELCREVTIREISKGY